MHVLYQIAVVDRCMQYEVVRKKSSDSKNRDYGVRPVSARVILSWLHLPLTQICLVLH